MTNATRVKEEQISVVRVPIAHPNPSEVDARVYQFENPTLEQVANEDEESRRFDLLKAYLLQLSSCDYLEQSEVVSGANYLRKLVRSENTELQTKVAELLLQYLRLMKVNTAYDEKLGGIQDSMLLFKLYQVVHDDSCHYLLPNLKAGEVFSKFLCTLLAVSSSEYVFNSVVKLFQRTVQNILAKYKKDSGSVDEMSTDDARVVIAVMKTLLTITRSFGAPPAPVEVLCSLSVAVVNSTKAHLCRLYSYNLIAFLIRDITDKQTLDKLLNGLDPAQYNQVTSLVKESSSLSNTCNWRFKYSPVDTTSRKQNEHPPNNANLYSSPYKQQAVESVNKSQSELSRQQLTSTKDCDRTPSRNYVNTVTQSDQSRRLQSPHPTVVPRSPQSISRYNARSGSNGSNASNSSVIYRSGDENGNGHSVKDKDAYDTKRQKTTPDTPSRLSAQGALPANWYKDLFKTFDTNRGEGKSVVVDKNAWKLKNDQLVNALTLLEKCDRVDLDAVSSQFVKLFEGLLNNESAIPVVVNSLNLFTMLLVKSECDLLTVSKSHTLADSLFQKLKDSNKKVRDACVQALVEVIKRCKLTMVSESIKKALSSVSPTCRENACNFLNGKLLTTSDPDFFEKLRHLLSILSDYIRQMKSDKVAKVRSALASLLEVVDDFNQVYSNQPVTTGLTADRVTQVTDSTKSTVNEYALTDEQQASLVIDDSDRVLTTTNTYDMTTATSYYDAESGSEFTVPQYDQQNTVTTAQLTNVVSTVVKTATVSENVVPVSSTTVVEDQEKVKEDPVFTSRVTSRVAVAPQDAAVTNTVNRGVVQSDPTSEDVAGQVDDVGVRTVRLPSITGIDPKTGVERRKIVAVTSLQKVVEEKVLEEFKTNDVETLNQALYGLTQWMTNNSKMQKVVDFYLLRLVNEYHADFKEADILQRFYTLMCKEELSEDALTELMVIVKKYKEPMVMVSLMLTNNKNIDRFLNPLNYAYATVLAIQKQDVIENTSARYQTRGAQKRSNEQSNSEDKERDRFGNNSDIISGSTGMCEVNQMLLSVFETISTTISREYLSIDTDLQIKIMDFLVYFVKTSKDPYATKASDALWTLDESYGVFKYMDDREVILLKFSRPSKDLKAACRLAESRIKKYVSSELYSCMFELDYERKKKACSFWKGYLGGSDRKRDEMLMSDSRKDLTAWLASCMFENKCERVVIELFEMVVNYMETMGLTFSVDESMWLVECFLSYSTFGKSLHKALAVYSRIAKIMNYSVEIVRTMCSYLETVQVEWVEAIKESLERVIKTESTDHELFAYVSRKLTTSASFRNSMDESRTLVNSETSSQRNDLSPVNGGSVSQSQAAALLSSQVATSSLERQVESRDIAGVKRSASDDLRAEASDFTRDLKRRSPMARYQQQQLHEQQVVQQLQQSPRALELQQQYQQQQQQLYQQLEQLRQQREQNHDHEELYRQLQKLRQQHQQQQQQLYQQLEQEQYEQQQQQILQRIQQFEEQQRQRQQSHQVQQGVQKQQLQQQQQAQQVQQEQVDSNVASRIVQRVVPRTQVPEQKCKEVTVENLGQSLKDLNEKYKVPTASLETLTTNPSLEGMETLTTNVSRCDTTQERQNTYSLEFDQCSQEAGNEDAQQMRGVKEASDRQSQGQVGKSVGTSVEKSSQVSAERVQPLRESNNEESTTQKLMEEVILGEDVTLDLESCRSLSQQIVEKPVHSLDQQPKESKPPYMSATLEETRYVFVGDFYGSNNKATVEDGKVGDVSRGVDTSNQRLEDQLQSPKSKKRRKLNAGGVYEGEVEEDEEVDVAERRHKNARTGVTRTYDKEAVKSVTSGTDNQVVGDAKEYCGKETPGYGDKDKESQSQKVHSDLSRLVRSYEGQTDVQNIVEDEDDESCDGEPRQSADRYSTQKSGSSSRLCDKDPSKYHPYIKSLTGDLAPPAVLEQDNDEEINGSDEKGYLDTVSANSKDLQEDPNGQVVTHSESGKSQAERSGYGGEEDSAKRPFSTNVTRSVDFVDSDPDCLRDELGLSLVETVLSLCSRVNDVCLVSSYREYQRLLPTLYPADVPTTLAQSFGHLLRHRNAFKGTFLRLLTPPLLEASHNALLLLSKLAYKNVQAGEPVESLMDAIVNSLEVFKLVTRRLQEKSVLRFCNVVTSLLALPKVLFQNEKLYSLVSSLVSENALKQSKSIMYKLLDVMIEVSMESLNGELDRLMMAKLRFTKILQMQILVGLKNTETGYAPESETLRQKHMDFISRLENFIKSRRAQNVDNVIRTSNYIVRTI
ncbi:HEAT repeat containing protein [Theileria orientalis]|uniref:HEAT repeat containing protein n=1 Tax=Theileria orientalis TaxID=68886 RepID=A0A976M9I2_THEOR|nr:HEAT repeat containing protein [Theileria orientalis]